jgi:hypothetical protein
MGAWGPGLYQDDEAADLRNTISLLSKMPGVEDAGADGARGMGAEGLDQHRAAKWTAAGPGSLTWLRVVESSAGSLE